MATAEDLMGASIIPLAASMLGTTPQTVTCTGTAQSTAAGIYQHNVTLSAASSQTGAILPAAAKVGTPYFFNTSSSTGAVVYCPVGHTLVNTTAATSALNGSATLAQYKSGIAWKASQTSATVAIWIYGALA